MAHLIAFLDCNY